MLRGQRDHTQLSVPVWSGRAASAGRGIIPTGRIPPPHAARSGEGLHASGRHLAPITGPRQAPAARGCGAAAERGQCGLERSRLRSHEKLPPPAFLQRWGRGNGRVCRASARSCARSNELWFNERDQRAPGDSWQGVTGGLSPLWVCSPTSWAMPGAGLVPGSTGGSQPSKPTRCGAGPCCPHRGRGCSTPAHGLRGGKGLQPLSQTMATIPWATSPPSWWGSTAGRGSPAAVAGWCRSEVEM